MTRSFQRFAGWCALLVAITGVVFTIAFAIVVRDGTHSAKWVSAIALVAVGLVAVPVWLALSDRLGSAEPQFARLGLAAGVVGSLGAALHGAYDVANLANPVGHTQDLPSQVDPRGLSTFGLVGLALLIFGWLASRSDALPRPLATLGLVGGALLVVLYLGRLTVLDPHDNLIKVVAIASGLVTSPLFYLGFAGNLLGVPVAAGRPARR
jgi:hypothetical protein